MPDIKENMNINIGISQPDYHAIDAAILAKTLHGIEQLAHVVNDNVNPRGTRLSVKIVAGFSEGSFDFHALFEIAGGLLGMAQNIIDIFKQVIEYRRFLGAKPAEAQTELPERGEVQIVNHAGSVAVFNNVTLNIGDSGAAIEAIQKIFTPLAHDAESMEISKGKNDPDPLLVTREGGKALIEPANSHTEKENQEEVIENELERILLIRKADFLANSKWQFSFDNEMLSMPVEDKDWLDKFHAGEIALRSGDSLKVVLLEKDSYGPNGELIRREFSIRKVVSLIRTDEQLSFF